MNVSTRRATATERFHAQAGKRKINPLILLFSGIGVAFLAAAGLILFGGGEDPEALRDRFEALRSEGADLQGRDRPDDAAAKYRAAIALVEGDERFRSPVADLKARIRELAQRKAELKDARDRFEVWKRRVGQGKPVDQVELCIEGRKLLLEVEQGGVQWQGELKSMLEGLEKERDRQAESNPSFEAVREGIRVRFVDVRDWSGAIRAWRERAPGEERRVEAEIAKIHQRAREEFDGLRKKALRLGESGEKPEALRLLEAARPRFERTPPAADLEKLRLELTR